MAETQTTAAAPVDAAAIRQMIADSLAAALKPVTESLGALSANQKVLADTMAAAPPAPAKADAPAKDKDKPVYLTAEEARKAAQEEIATALAAQQKAAQASAARTAFITEKLKGVPAPYAAKLGDDPSKWAAEELVIRDSLKSDLAALGVKAPDVHGGAGGNATGAAEAAAAAAANKFNDGSLTKGQAAFAAGIKMPA